MRRVVLSLAVLAGFVFCWPAEVRADDLLFGQRHYYSVTLRGNGEAVVTARLVFTNHGDSPQKTFSFNLAGIDPTEVAGYQQSLQSRCLSYGSGTVPKNAAATVMPVTCAQYEAPDYISFYPSNPSTYDKLKLRADDTGAYTVELPKAVPAGETSALLLSYAGKGFAHEQLGRFVYNVQTIKVGERVKQSTVAIDVDAGLYIEDPSSKVNYQSTASDASKSVTANSVAGESARLDSLAYSVGQSGTVIKEAKDLAPYETLSVKGVYADASWKLHAVRLVVTLGIGLVLLLGVTWLLWRRRKSLASIPARVAARATSLDSGKPELGHRTLRRLWFDPVYLGVSFGSVALCGILAWWLGYLNENSSVTDAFTGIVLVVMSFMVFMVLLIGPALWLGWRSRDVRIGVVVFMWEIVWLVVLLAVYQWLILPLFTQPLTPPDVMPMSMEGTKETQ